MRKVIRVVAGQGEAIGILVHHVHVCSCARLSVVVHSKHDFVRKRDVQTGASNALCCADGRELFARCRRTIVVDS